MRLGMRGMLVAFTLILGVSTMNALAADGAVEKPEGQDYGAITVYGVVDEEALQAFDNVVEVAMYQMQFSPKNLVITPGTTVVWVNNEEIEHNATFFPGSGIQRRVVGPMLKRGQRYAVTFNQVGRFRYQCDPHATVGMSGTVTVEAPE